MDVSIKGAPRYLKGRIAMVKTMILAIFVGGVLEKETWDFSRLMVVSDASEKTIKKQLRDRAS